MHYNQSVILIMCTGPITRKMNYMVERDDNGPLNLEYYETLSIIFNIIQSGYCVCN